MVSCNASPQVVFADFIQESGSFSSYFSPFLAILMKKKKGNVYISRLITDVLKSFSWRGKKNKTGGKKGKTKPHFSLLSEMLKSPSSGTILGAIVVPISSPVRESKHLNMPCHTLNCCLSFSVSWFLDFLLQVLKVIIYDDQNQC